MIKCVILDDDSNDQCIISIHFLAHPGIHAILNFKDNYIEIQDMKLPLKVITAVRPLIKLFLSTACDNVLEEIPEEERPLCQPIPPPPATPQLVFTNGTMFILETFTARPKD
uniref:Uncharacterized protein n=1 Tax=Romanomermis culicivorax TaxID=13658 RepID=A0A915HQA9_ROMCU